MPPKAPIKIFAVTSTKYLAEKLVFAPVDNWVVLTACDSAMVNLQQCTKRPFVVLTCF